MSQDFQGGVGQVAEGDINNFGLSINLTDKPEFRGLVTAQRKELHELRAKCEELGEDPRDMWRMVHAQLGVTTISEIASDQFPLARSTIQGRLKQLQDGTDKRRLVGKITRAVAEEDIGEEVDNFCELNFGRTELEHLDKPQLQKTLEFVLMQKTEKQGLTTKPQAVETSIVDFLLVNKKSAVTVFLFGILIGSIWL